MRIACAHIETVVTFIVVIVSIGFWDRISITKSPGALKPTRILKSVAKPELLETIRFRQKNLEEILANPIRPFGGPY